MEKNKNHQIFLKLPTFSTIKYLNQKIRNHRDAVFFYPKEGKQKRIKDHALAEIQRKSSSHLLAPASVRDRQSRRFTGINARNSQEGQEWDRGTGRWKVEWAVGRGE